MDFSFTEEQLLFRDAVRDILAKECTPAAVRASWKVEKHWREQYLRLTEQSWQVQTLQALQRKNLVLRRGMEKL